MSEVVDYIDEETGEHWQTHIIDYPYHDGTYSIYIVATSKEDSLKRLETAYNYGTYAGVTLGRIPAYPGAGMWVRFWCWWKNRKGAEKRGRVEGQNPAQPLPPRTQPMTRTEIETTQKDTLAYAEKEKKG